MLGLLLGLLGYGIRYTAAYRYCEVWTLLERRDGVVVRGRNIF